MTQNILSYALSNDCKIGFSSGTFPGNSYTEELPDEGIKYGTWEITKRSQNTITIKVFSPYKSTMWVNSYVNTAGWNGWKQMVVNTDLRKVTHKKNFGGFSANSMREFLIAVINKVLENNLWTSTEDVIVFCATWFGNSYGMGILASQNNNNDIIISYDSEDGNSYTMHYVPSTNTVKAFYKRQGTSLL